MAEGDVRSAVIAGVGKWARTTANAPAVSEQYGLVDSVMEEIKKTGDREVRTLRWKVKSLGRELGKAGHRIYDLRCRLIEAQALTSVDRSGYRAMVDRTRAAEQRVADLAKELYEAQRRVRELESELEESKSLTVG